MAQGEAQGERHSGLFEIHEYEFLYSDFHFKIRGHPIFITEDKYQLII
jgi:hypothetical protein